MEEEGGLVAECWNSRDGGVVNCVENTNIIEFSDGCFSSYHDLKLDKCDSETRVLFDQLFGIFVSTGIRSNPPLLGNGLPVDLFKLFCLVRDSGGFGSVKSWALIAEKLGFDSELSVVVKLIYLEYLDEFHVWLDRIAGKGICLNGSYGCGGTLCELALRLEEKLTELCGNRKGFVRGYEQVECDEICNVSQDIGSRKRKREVIVEMLSWLNMIAKDPRDQAKGGGNWCEGFWLAALSLRESWLPQRNSGLTNDQSFSHQKKKKMHPSMYEDVSLPDDNTHEGLRCSNRLLSLVESSSSSDHSSSYSLTDHWNTTESPCQDTAANRNIEQEPINTDSPTVKNTPNSFSDDPPIKKHVSIGPKSQAEVPIWHGVVSESDPKWLGTQHWSPDPKVGNSCPEFNQPGKGRVDCCNCSFPGSVECYRFHIAERRMKLRHELGLVFFRWKFDQMGEEVSLSWSDEEEKIFKQIIKSNRLCRKPVLPKKRRTDFFRIGKTWTEFFRIKKRRTEFFRIEKTWTELVSYYFNVYKIQRRSYQNRVTPKEIDSDGDRVELGLVSKPFGFRSVDIPETKLVACSLNEQVSDLDWF